MADKSRDELLAELVELNRRLPESLNVQYVGTDGVRLLDAIEQTLAEIDQTSEVVS